MEQIDITNKSKRWNQEEENLLKKLYNDDELDVMTISKQLKRTPNGMSVLRTRIEVSFAHSHITEIDKNENNKI